MTTPPPYRRPDPRLRIITEALRQPVPNVATADLITGSNIARFDTNVDHAPAPWAMQVDMLANRIYTALYGRPDAEAPLSPLAQAEDAKRRRDLGGELGALRQGQRALECASWYPAQAGDILHVHYEAVRQDEYDVQPACGETYIVEHSEEEGGLVLRLVHASPTGFGPGAFAPGMVDAPFMEAWFEAGPHRLTIVRCGRVVHNGADLS